MALALLEGYSSPSEQGSDSDSDSDSDDGIVVTIDRRVLSGQKPAPVKRPPPSSRTQHREVKRERREERVGVKLQHAEPPTPPSPPMSTLNMPHWDLGQQEQMGLEQVPLPRSIEEMFLKDVEAERALDDPALHEGRTRSFSHHANSWASYVFLEPADLEFGEARELICQELEMEPIAQPHLSLSRVVSLRHHWLDPLVASLTHSLGQERRFHLTLDRLQVYVNDEGTRTFVGLTAAAGYPQLSRLSRRVDCCLAEYNLPPFYRPPSFHVSLAWCLGDRRGAILPRLTALSLKLVDCLDDEAMLVKTLRCKAGNKKFNFDLI